MIRLGKFDCCSVGSCLIPALNNGAYRAGNDGEKKHVGHAPFVQDLVTKSIDFLLIEGFVACDIFIAGWVARNESAFPDDSFVLLKPFISDEFVDC